MTCRNAGRNVKSAALWLLLDPANSAEAAEPALLRAAPDLNLGNELIALARGADADVVGLRPVSRRRCIDRRAAARAKCLRAFRSALCRLYVDRRLDAENLEGAVGGADR